MGSGMLALPYIMSRSGIAVFVVLMLLMALVVDYSLWLLLSSAKTSGTKSYEDLCDVVSCTSACFGRSSMICQALGSWGRVIVCVAIVVQNSGAMTTYLKVVGDILPKAIEQLGIVHVDRTLLMITTTGGIVMPLTALKSISWLGSVSGVSIMLMLFFCIIIIARSSDSCHDDDHNFGDDKCRGSGAIEPVNITTVRKPITHD